MVDSVIDLAYTDRASSVNERLGTTVIGNSSAPTQKAASASTEDIQGLQQKISELKIENLKLKVESLEAAAINDGVIADPYKPTTNGFGTQTTTTAQCNKPEAINPQKKQEQLKELNAAKAELAAAKAELANPNAAGNNSGKNINEMTKELFQLNVENKELQRNTLLEEKEQLAKTPPSPCKQNQVNPRETELKAELAAADKELRNAKNMLNQHSNDNSSQFVSKNYVKLLSGIASESINESKEHRKGQLENKVEKLEANLNSKPSGLQQCKNQQNDVSDQDRQRLLAEAKAELASITG